MSAQENCFRSPLLFITHQLNVYCHLLLLFLRTKILLFIFLSLLLLLRDQRRKFGNTAMKNANNSIGTIIMIDVDIGMWIILVALTFSDVLYIFIKTILDVVDV